MVSHKAKAVERLRYPIGQNTSYTVVIPVVTFMISWKHLLVAILRTYQARPMKSTRLKLRRPATFNSVHHRERSAMSLTMTNTSRDEQPYGRST